MKIIKLVLCSSFVFGAFGCAATTQNTPAAKTNDPEQSAALEKFMRDGFAAMDAGNIGYWKNSADAAALSWDIGDKGQPVAARGKAELDAQFDGFQKTFAEGAKVTTTLTNLECHAISASGYCTVEFDQTFTMGGETMGPMKLRGTGVAERQADGTFHWTHWHSSYREMPQMPAAPAEATAAAPEAPSE